jgi:hypothetical protein
MRVGFIPSKSGFFGKRAKKNSPPPWVGIRGGECENVTEQKSSITVQFFEKKLKELTRENRMSILPTH